MPQLVTALYRQLCPESLRGPLQRLGYWARVRTRRLEVITSLEEFDRRVAHIDFQQADADLAWLNRLHYRATWRLPADPESTAYRQAVMQTYLETSGRASYQAADNEWAPEPTHDALPHPYSTGSAVMVAEHLYAIGFLFRLMQLKPGMSVLEFGPGSGGTTCEMARFGVHVTAVDINPHHLALIARRCQGLKGTLRCIPADMLDFRTTDRFDRILFFQSFHHNADPPRMLDRLEHWLAPQGRVVFAGEPILDGFPIPWGLRTDGLSLYCIRKFGWLELGFRTSYFRAALARRGWSLSYHPCLDVPRIQAYVARRR